MSMADCSFSTASLSMSSTDMPSADFGAAAITTGFPPRATILPPRSVAWSNDSLASSRKCSTIGFRDGPKTWKDHPRYFNADVSSIPRAWFIAAITFAFSINSPRRGNRGSGFKFGSGLGPASPVGRARLPGAAEVEDPRGSGKGDRGSPHPDRVHRPAQHLVLGLRAGAPARGVAVP